MVSVLRTAFILEKEITPLHSFHLLLLFSSSSFFLDTYDDESSRSNFVMDGVPALQCGYLGSHDKRDNPDDKDEESEDTAPLDDPLGIPAAQWSSCCVHHRERPSFSW